MIEVLGEALAHPIAQCLRDIEAKRVVLVLCGPLAAAPLHAASWRDDEGTTCLLDEFILTYVPSALVRSVSLQRANERGGDVQTLLALGNPDLGDPCLDLEGSAAEVEELSRFFGPEHATVKTRSAAKSDVLLDRIEAVTHLHLACHGRGALFNPADAAVLLSDGWLSALELKPHLEPSLTVISACEAALVDIADLPDEAISLSTAFLAAGSARVVATLWPIDDLATAILMTRFYEELDGAIDAAAALRRSQLWLRDLTESEEAKYLEAHPALKVLMKKRSESGRPGARSDAATVQASFPYRHPDLWAPFVASGA